MEKILHTLSSTLHILAAVTWIGSMIYSEFAIKPALKTLDDMKAHSINGIAMKKFSGLTWASLIILVLTGFYAAYDKKDKLIPIFHESPGIALTFKLILVTILFIILLLQVFVYGPKMGNLISPSTPKNQENQMAMTQTTKTAEVLSKVHLYAGIVIIILGVILSQLLEK
ncbi:putative copper resistance protein D [Anaerosolibacter carboniphilus]|uniref:Putative copper resistance protein D n=1 Tax=Anaerosolibacter carboniphilus TaxID=1417629 RepID=A0A841KV29_9FIRM|nr:DUF4149 domain-containing protein [Anaerosolibacter carboniphilus]MBB6216048.1 putative copper resistance protein D [Anaerosolibacter carboniphilus]